MNYQKQYENKINWQNTPSTSTPLNATNLNKMDNALFYMDNTLYILTNILGGGSDIRGGIISRAASGTFSTNIALKFREELGTGEILLLRSTVSGTGNNLSIWTDEHSAEGFGFVDLDGEETSITITDESIIFLMLDADERTATVLSVMDESGGIAGLGIGKMTNYSSGVITTDIDLHRDPVIGDRILLYCSSNISVSNDSIKTYNDGVAVTTDIGPILPQTIVKGFNVLECVAAIPAGIAWSVKLNVPIVANSAGLGISINNNGVISNTNPRYGSNYDYKKIDSAISDGDLGNFNGYCDNLIIDFDVDAVAGENGYTLTLITGTTTIIREYAVLKDRSGNLFTRNIKAGMVLKCESNVSGSGTIEDPVVVTVLNENIMASGDIIDGNGNILSEVSALETSASGNPIIVNAVDVACKELSVEIEPIQDLHGYSYPWAGGAGKNQIDVSQTMYASTFHGITSQIVSETFKASGTVADGVGYYLGDTNKKQLLKAGTYTITIFPSGNWGTNTEIRLRKASDSSRITGVMTDATTKYATFTLSEDTYVFLAVVNSDATVGTTVNASLTVQIESGSSSTSYEPYSNICPISGRTETTVDDHGKNFLNANILSTWKYGTENIFSVSNDNVTVNRADSTSEASETQFFSLKAGTYTWSIQNGARMQIAWDGAKQIDTYTYDTKSVTFTLSTDKSNIHIKMLAQSYPYTIGHIQIEQGSTATAYEPYKSSSVTLSLGQTVYGGQVDFKTGEGIITHGITTIGDLTAVGRSTSYAHPFFFGSKAGAKIGGSIYSSSYKVIEPLSAPDFGDNAQNGDISKGPFNEQIFIRDDAFTDATAWQTARADQTICYELATPIELTLTPSMLKLLKGYNYITGDGEMVLVYIPESVLGMPTPPTADGNYKLRCTVSGGVPVFSWVSDT